MGGDVGTSGVRSTLACQRGFSRSHRNTRTLAQLVDDLLDVSRMISGKMRLDVVPMDLGDVIDAAVEAVLPAASAKDIGIHVVIDPAARSMTGDPIRLQQAVWNLLSNAVKFTPAGGRVDVSTRVHDGDDRDHRQPTQESASTRRSFPTCSIASARRMLRAPVLTPGLAWAWRSFVTSSSSTEAACAPRASGRDAGTRFVHPAATHSAVPDGRRRAESRSALAGERGTGVPRLDGVRVLIVDDDRESCEMMLEALRGYGASLRARCRRARPSMRCLSSHPISC